MKDHRYFLSVVSAVQDAYRPQDQPDLPLEHQRREVAAIIFRVGNPVAGAGRGNRTPTGLSALRILSPLRLPVSPSRLCGSNLLAIFNLVEGRLLRFDHVNLLGVSFGVSWLFPCAFSFA